MIIVDFPDGLQRCLDTLRSFEQDCKFLVNLRKTKLMVFHYVWMSWSVPVIAICINIIQPTDLCEAIKHCEGLVSNIV